ncbi:small ribosomal subunit Rsm22 family protein [Halobacteriovorax sp. DPLXC-1]|uniref:small ribosomal subunit Rsm22 family protein n=1 Tax=Halobacteriovorax sp. DPLXC-1 TaxID=3110771 RepID=UPI002FF2062B
MFDYDAILNSLLNPKLNKQQLGKLVQIQSQQFTSERKNLKENYSNEDLISAYTAFYFPTNAYKLDFLFSQLSEESLSAISETTIIDIGCGPGTYTYAAANLLPNVKEFIGVDESELMLKQAKKLNDEYFKEDRVFFKNRVPQIENSTLIFGNSLNEMGMKVAFKLIKNLKPKFIICIEPGTKEVFKEVLELRRKLLNLEYKVNYPCMGQGSCPLQETDDWCHQSIKVSLDYELESLSQVAKLDRKVMPATIHLYSLSDENKPVVENEARLIRLKRIVKHAYLWEVCTIENKIVSLEVPKKLFKKKMLKQLDAISSGIKLSYTIDKKLENSTFRVKEIEVEID